MAPNITQLPDLTADVDLEPLVADHHDPCSHRSRRTHHFRRLYLGPMPVPSSKARSIAAAILADSTITEPEALAIAGRDGQVLVAGTPVKKHPHLVKRPGPDGAPFAWSAGEDEHGNKVIDDLASTADALPKSSEDGQGVGHDGSDPVGSSTADERTLLELPERPQRRRLARDGSTTSMMSAVSFASAHSLPSSVLSEADADLRSGRTKARRLGDRTRSMGPRQASNASIATVVPTTSSRRAARQSASEGGGEPSGGRGVEHVHYRRRGSLGNVLPDMKADLSRASASDAAGELPPLRGIWNKEFGSGIVGTESRALPLLDLPVKETDEPPEADDTDGGFATDDLSMVTGERAPSIIDHAPISPTTVDPSPSRNTLDTAVTAGSDAPTTISPFSGGRSQFSRTAQRPSALRGNANASLTRQQAREYARKSIGAAGSDEGHQTDDIDTVVDTDSLTVNGMPLKPTDPNATTDSHIEHAHFSNDDPRESRADMIKNRARQRYLQGQGSAPPASEGHDRSRSASASRAGHHPARDVSRASRMSRASTAGTLGSVGTRGTEGTFGATGGVRDMLVRAVTRKQDRSRPREDESERAARVDRRRLRLNRNLSHNSSIGSASVGTSIAPSRRAVFLPAGAVGTSAGGTKWVGSSFEVGQRLLEVFEVTKQRCAEVAQEAADHLARKRAEDARIKAAEDSAAAASSRGDQGSRRGPGHGMEKSPSKVLSAMAAEANEAAEERNPTWKRQATPPGPAVEEESKSQSADERETDVDATTDTGLDGHETAGSIDFSEHATTDLSRSAASLLPVPHGGEERSIRSFSHRGYHRPRRSEVGSFISQHTHASSAGESVSLADLGLHDRVKHRGVRALEQGLKALAPTKRPSIRVHSHSSWKGKHGLFFLDEATQAPDADSQTPTASGARTPTANATLDRAPVDPLEDVTSDADTDFASAIAIAPSTTSTVQARQTLQHPDPPLAAEDRFPELTLSLLRRGSDAGEPVTTETASDHEVVVRPSIIVDSPIQEKELDGPLSKDGSPLSDREDSPAHLAPVLLSELSPEGTDSVTSEEAKADGDSPAVDDGATRKRTVQFESRPPLNGRSLTADAMLNGKDLSGAAKRVAPGSLAPLPPSEVLARPASHAPERSADDAVTASPLVSQVNTPTEICYPATPTAGMSARSVIKRDRMLVKMHWTASEDVPSNYDELASRRYVTHTEPWKEFMVVLRLGKVELWNDPNFANKFLGRSDRLHLHCAIPLRRGRTYLSLYSPIDRIFCLTFQGEGHTDVHSRKRPHFHQRNGTSIVIFDARAQSVSQDWMWEIWRELGGTIPETLEIHVPALDLRVRFPIPDQIPATPASDEENDVLPAGERKLTLLSLKDSHQRGEGFKLINRANIIKTFSKLIANVPDWCELVKAQEAHNLGLELAWRRGTQLDWIVDTKTVDGLPRDWAVLGGLVLKQPKVTPMLELRVAQHYPTMVRLATGEKMDEPPAMEGFLWRVKPVSNALTRLYATTHDGHIFICRPSRAFTPDRHLATEAQVEHPPSMGLRRSRTRNTMGHGANGRSSQGGFLARMFGRDKTLLRDDSLSTLRDLAFTKLREGATTLEEVNDQIEACDMYERRRQFEQVSGADGYVDLRDIKLVRCVGRGPVHRLDDDRAQANRKKAVSDAEDSEWVDGEAFDEDIGGEEGLAAAQDRAATRASRQFEVVMANGRTIRFETFSAAVARQWIDGFAKLARYWKRREKVDALEMMNASGIDPALVSKRAQEGQSTFRPIGADADTERVGMVLGTLWNWCVLEHCRGTVRSGTLFHKKKAYAPFHMRQYILISGRLLCFKLMRNVRTARARQNAGIFHRRTETVVHLRDAYVYSGQLTEEMLTNGHSEGAQTSNSLGGGGGVNTGERHRLPRVYRDGLLSVDEDEDCTFVVRYRPQRANKPAGAPGSSVVGETSGDALATARARAATSPAVPVTPSPSPSPAPPPVGSLPILGDKTHKHLVLRARSRLERDLWVRAIHVECERIVREDRVREEALRNMGRVDGRW